jgi:SAM-dependent methyltransferase
MHKCELIEPVKRRIRKMMGYLPPRLEYLARRIVERIVYSRTKKVHHLPPIFHYWSNKYLRPVIEKNGFNSPDDFYLQCLKKAKPGSKILSLASGDCALEEWLANGMIDHGLKEFTFHCTDMNTSVLKRASNRIEKNGLTSFFRLDVVDLNNWNADITYDFVIAHHSLHHMINLETIFSEIEKGLTDDGFFLSCDVIGRNGHKLWPEALEAIQPFWNELPPAHRFDRALGKVTNQFINIDFSEGCFEGIRAQDILPLLISKFDFTFFQAYAGMTLSLIDRRFGWNFDPEVAWDRDWVDRLYARDLQLIEQGKIKPTQMIAAMRKKTSSEKRQNFLHTIDPESCVRK